MSNDSDLECNAWQNAVRALTGKNKALQEQKQLLQDSLETMEKEVNK